MLEVPELLVPLVELNGADRLGAAAQRDLERVVGFDVGAEVELRERQVEVERGVPPLRERGAVLLGRARKQRYSKQLIAFEEQRSCGFARLERHALVPRRI